MDQDSIEQATKEQDSEGEKIEQGFSQMEMLYKSRCVQPPGGNSNNNWSNVTVREIVKDK